MGSDHFEDKSPLAHVIERQTEGIVTLSESHGIEMAGHISAGADAMRETALLLALVALPLTQLTYQISLPLLCAFALGLIVWKTGRSGWLAWARLERLHRLIEQEKREIEQNRPQEREELHVLYHSKGFTGKLLDDVLDVLMADNDRLLKVMLEEELGLTLENYEHPIKQACGALIGTLFALLVTTGCYFLSPIYGLWIATPFLIGVGAYTSAIYERNRPIPAIVWNLAIGAFAFGCSFLILRMMT